MLLDTKLLVSLHSPEKEIAQIDKPTLDSVKNELLSASARLIEQADIIKNSIQATITAITKLSELRDPYTSGHARRVADLSAAIAASLGFSEDFQTGIRAAGHLHDIGKVGVPSELLSCPGRVSDIQMALLRTHVEAGWEIIKNIHFPWPIETYVLQHHERLDGSGYPHHTQGLDLFVGSRILAVADVVEAMASHRPYRQALGIDAALAEIGRGAGIIYDLDVSAACVEIFNSGYKLLTI